MIYFYDYCYFYCNFMISIINIKFLILKFQIQSQNKTKTVSLYQQNVNICYNESYFYKPTAWNVSTFRLFLVRIQPECREILTKKIPKTDTFYAVIIKVYTQNISSVFIYLTYLCVLVDHMKLKNVHEYDHS